MVQHNTYNQKFSIANEVEEFVLLALKVICTALLIEEQCHTHHNQKHDEVFDVRIPFTAN